MSGPTPRLWLLTRKDGRDGYVTPSDINDGAQTAGLSPATAVSVGKDWSGTRLKSGKR